MNPSIFLLALVGTLLSLGLVKFIQYRRKHRLLAQRLTSPEQLERSTLRLHRRPRPAYRNPDYLR